MKWSKIVGIILVMFNISFYSCKEKSSNEIQINIIENDSLVKSSSIFLNKKYELIGLNNSLNEILLSNDTDKKIPGNFGVGIKEIENSRNRAFLFVTDYKERIYSLPELSNPTDYSLSIEYEKSINERNLQSILIEKDENALTSAKAYKLTFAFINNQKDTLGFQTTYQLIHKNQLCTINYLFESRENIKELEKQFEGIALNAYKN